MRCMRTRSTKTATLRLIADMHGALGWQVVRSPTAGIVTPRVGPQHAGNLQSDHRDAARRRSAAHSRDRRQGQASREVEPDACAIEARRGVRWVVNGGRTVAPELKAGTRRRTPARLSVKGYFRRKIRADTPPRRARAIPRARHSQPARYLRFSSASESGTLVTFMFAPS